MKHSNDPPDPSPESEININLPYNTQIIMIVQPVYIHKLIIYFDASVFTSTLNYSIIQSASIDSKQIPQTL